MRVTVTYQLSPKELERGFKQIARKRRALLLTLVPLLGGIGALDLAVGKTGLGVFAIPLAGFYVVMLVAGPRIVASQAASRSCLPTETTFTEQGYATRTELTSTEARWQMLTKTEETAEFFLLYTAVRRAVIVPKRAFTAEQAAELRAFLSGAPMSRTLPPVAEPRDA